MKIPFLDSFIRRYRCRRLRRSLRGYRRLKSTGNLDRIGDINRVLTVTPLNIPKEKISPHFFSECLNQASLACRQYLLSRLAYVELNRTLLASLGNSDSPVAYFLPPEWRKVINSHGFRISARHTAVLWNAYVGLMLVYGIFRILKILLTAVRRDLATPLYERYAYFDGLSPGNLPRPSRDNRSHDIISWYMQWPGKPKTVDTICHSVTVGDDVSIDGARLHYMSSAIPPLSQSVVFTRFVAWSGKAILIAIADYVRGRWWHPVMLNQAALSAQVRLQVPEKLAADYLFHNSGYIYRPLWTYAAEARGARILFYFYSTNCEGFMTAKGYPPVWFGWQAMNWPHYLAWDDENAGFVRRAVGEVGQISRVGPIWFQSTNEAEMPRFNGCGVAVFDISPVRDALYVALGLDMEYYVPDTSIHFLNDIRRAAQNAGLKMLWKRKRKQRKSSLDHPIYIRFADCLSGKQSVIIGDPDISAYRVIESCEFVISMPFTSTALIARDMGKPSCYYDPMGLVMKKDRAAHGIEIVNGPDELRRWLSTGAVDPSQ